MSKHGKAKGRRDSDRCLIVSRSVTFNLEDEWQRRIYEATLDWPNFSGRVKRLLEREIDGIVKAAFDLPKGTEMEAEKEQPVQQVKQEGDEYNPVLHFFGREV